MKVPVSIVAAVVAAIPLGAQAAPRVATTLPAAELAALDVERKQVWVDWYTGDTTALRRSLGPELVGMSPDNTQWQSLGESLAASAAYRASGAKLVSVSFEKTTIHRFGEVVVMFSHYAVETEKGGQKSTDRGRATEVFVRHQGKWVHTSWHLDRAP